MIRLAVAVTAILIGVIAAACRGSDSEPEPVATISEVELTRPETLRICSDMSRPPMEYRTRAGARTGFEVDVMEEVARRLALAPVWVDTRRVQLIDAVVSERCDVIASSLPVRLEDQHRINEIAYLVVPISLLVRDEAPAPLALRALETGRVDALLDAAPSNDWYARRRPDRVETAVLLPGEEERYAIGYGVQKNSIVLAVRGALLTMHQDGTFASLMARWGLEDVGVRGLPIP